MRQFFAFPMKSGQRSFQGPLAPKLFLPPQSPDLPLGSPLPQPELLSSWSQPVILEGPLRGSRFPEHSVHKAVAPVSLGHPAWLRGVIMLLGSAS